MTSQSLIRGLALVALAGTAWFAAAILALHVLQPELSPMNEAMSYYVHGPHGWLLTTALLTIGAGSLALSLGLARIFRGTAARVGMAFLVVWSIGAILGGSFAADPPGNWDRPPSLSGAIHGISAIVALTAFPVAAMVIANNLRHPQDRLPVAGWIRRLAYASLIAYIAFAASLLPVMIRPGPPIILGLTERVLLAIYAAWLAVAAVWLMQPSTASAPAERR